jgi:predicted enzyme related to lactoylglutathione lyase
VESFETYRPYLLTIAYRMLGSAMDAEDMVQENYLRSQTTPSEPIRSLKAYLTTIIVVSDYARALAFYRDVLGATVVRELPDTLCFLSFRGSQILLSAPGGLTKDKPTDRNSAIGELIIAIATINTWNRINVTTRQVAGSGPR